MRREVTYVCLEKRSDVVVQYGLVVSGVYVLFVEREGVT